MSKFTERQTGWREVLVQGDNHSILMDLYHRVLQVMESMLDTSLFMFGGRPSLADFGLYAQLSQCAIDPSASAIMRARAQRTFQWTQTLDDCSGIDGEWALADQPSPALKAMLQLVGEFYLPFLLAHAKAMAHGEETFTKTRNSPTASFRPLKKLQLTSVRSAWKSAPALPKPALLAF